MRGKDAIAPHLLHLQGRRSHLKAWSSRHPLTRDEGERCDRLFPIIQQLANLQTLTKVTHFFSLTEQVGVGYSLFKFNS